MCGGLFCERDDVTRVKGIEFAEFLYDPPCAPEGEPPRNSPAALMTSRFGQRLLSGCRNCSPHPPPSLVRIMRNLPLIQDHFPRAHQSLFHTPAAIYTHYFSGRLKTPNPAEGTSTLKGVPNRERLSIMIADFQYLFRGVAFTNAASPFCNIGTVKRAGTFGGRNHP